MEIIEQSVVNLSCTPNALQMIERAGRTCYKSEDRITSDSAENFVAGIVKLAHESVLEHANATFKIVTDRGVTHELVRHRIASYSQESTRYVKYDKIKVVIPVDFKTARWSEIFGPSFPITIDHEDFPMMIDHKDISRVCCLEESVFYWLRSCFESGCMYQSMIDSGEKPQIARSVLPTCLATEIVMTANFREWRHFLKLRTARVAHPQIREVANMVKDWFVDHYPAIVFDI